MAAETILRSLDQHARRNQRTWMRCTRGVHAYVLPVALNGANALHHICKWKMLSGYLPLSVTESISLHRHTGSESKRQGRFNHSMNDSDRHPFTF